MSDVLYSTKRLPPVYKKLQSSSYARWELYRPRSNQYLARKLRRREELAELAQKGRKLVQHSPYAILQRYVDQHRQFGCRMQAKSRNEPS